MEIEFHIDKLDSFLPQIANQLGVDIVDDSFQIPPEQGKGYFTQLKFCDDIIITFYDLQLNAESTVIRKKSENDSIIPIVCWLTDSGIQQELNSERKKIGKSTPNGIFMPANSLETRYTLPKNEPIKNITVFITKDWLRNNIKEQNNFLNKVVLSNENYFIFEETAYDISEVLLKMEHALNNMEMPLAKVSLYANTLNLLHLFLHKIVNRPTERQSVNINPREIEILFKVKAWLINEYFAIPSTHSLAQKCGISIRKLQRLFRQVFGKSIYQFAMEVKMNEAKKMLATKKFSVSEVGHNVGYSNLSHFTLKFKETFGISPKSFISSL
jgi:AraC-like DNA-binding protein